MAFLHSGERALGGAVIESGLKIAYLCDASFGTEEVDFGSIPPFDLVIAGGERQTQEMAYVFIRARKPKSFVLVGDYHGLVARLANLLYRMEIKGDALVGNLEGAEFEWPAGIVRE